ncbi:Chitin synthase 2, partial [Tyrophagus putrescentiae]
MDKWKPIPKSFPDQRPGHGAADLNGYFDTRDTEVTSSDRPLQREESFAESTHSDSEPQYKFSKLRKARDSIFVARAHIGNDSDEEDEETTTERHPQVLIEEDIVVRRPTSNLSNKTSENARKSRASVRFSDLPEEGAGGVAGRGGGDKPQTQVKRTEGFSNPSFVDDHGNESEDYNEMLQNNGTTEWQSNLETNEFWARDSSSDDDDESALDYSKPAWDSFESIPTEDADETLSSEWSKFFLKLFKLISYGITFALVLGSGVVAKLSLSLIASMTRVNKTVVNCNPNLPDILDHDKHYHSLLGLNSPERFAWLWVLFAVLITPDVFTFLRSLKSCLFKQYEMPDIWSILVIFGTHSAEVVGVSLFAFVILPSIDVITGLIFTNCIFLLPAYCLFMSRYRRQPSKRQQQSPEVESGVDKSPDGNFLYYFYLTALVLQVVALLAWPVVLFLHNRYNVDPQHGVVVNRDVVDWLWIIPLSGALISLGFWENFTTENSNVKFLRRLGKIKSLSVVNKNAVYLYVSIWKCILYFAMLLLIQAFAALYHEKNIKSSWKTIELLFTSFTKAFNWHEIDLERENSLVNKVLHTTVNGWPPVILGLIQIGSSFLCYNTVLWVCKVCIQPFSFAIPINLILPVSVSLMNFFVNQYSKDVCFFSNIYNPFEYIFWNAHYNVFDLTKFFNWAILFLWLISFLSQVIINNHVWISSKERLAAIDKLFILPFFSSAVLEQSIMMNRRIDEELFERNFNNETHSDPSEIDENNNSLHSITSGIGMGNTGEKIRIYACATVWHETADELVQMLKSIMRVDEDQASRRLAVKWLKVQEHQVDYYEFETHLFVDDAFVFGKTLTENDRHINEYVKILIDVLNEAAENVHQRPVRIRPPRIYVTPYGGRVEWRLPGGTKLIAHLKDKLKIRHRKRWSQVMYMYYLLGFKIYEKEHDEQKRQKMTDKTFILALDGDINFRPEAVLLLVDLMKKNKTLGAACGRVHPVGTGPMAWYQVFEYAISHWLQKATEHVFGCVLCSPGCFSLFRASALVDINVMQKYTTKPTEALHYVQYDQGEDRWLCTLMLQQGWRVEYSAASDSYTHCPEGFGEFYIQRRRWAPSTMANIIDLLRSYKQTVKKNDNISSLYMLYQASIMLGTILSPGTIFLMLVGSVTTAFGLATQHSFYLNFCPTDMQILVAQILSVFYAMLMLAVLTSTAIEIKKETIFSPSVVFFVGMIFVFVVAAFIHPTEFFCLFPAPVYLLTIPSMYLLLTIYSMINLNIVTWGTRETAPSQQPTQPQAPAAQTQKKDSNLFDEIGNYFNGKNKWDFRCMCCTSTKNEEELYYLRDIRESIGKVNTEIGSIKNNVTAQTKLAKADLNLKRRSSMMFASRKVTFDDNAESRPLMDFIVDDEEIDEALNVLDSSLEEVNHKEDEQPPVAQFSAQNPPWIRDEGLENAKVVSIKKNERDFWTAFVAKYLAPLIEDKHHQDKVAADLIDLRNKAVFGFGIINIIFVLFVYLLQMNKDIFSITFHVNRHINGTSIDPNTGESNIVYTDTAINMDPISLILIIFFGSILFIQFIGMFMHRFGTITHLLAFTDITKEMRLPRRKSIAHELANRQKTARRMSLSADMHARHLRNFQQHQRQSFHNGSETESEPEIMTQFELNSDVVDGNNSSLKLRQVSTNFAENVIQDALESFNHSSPNQLANQNVNNQNDQPATLTPSSQ